MIVACAGEKVPAPVEKSDPPETILRSKYASPEVRARAIEQLRSKGREAIRPLASELAGQLRQREPAVARLASATLVDLGSDAAEALVASTETAELRTMALRTLALVPSPPSVVEKLGGASHSSDRRSRLRAIEVLGAMAGSTALAGEKLSKLLEDPDVAIRLTATRELWRARDPSAEVIAGIAKRLGDPEVAVQQEACRTLFLIGKGASPAIDRLKAAARSSRVETRELATVAYERIQCLQKDDC